MAVAILSIVVNPILYRAIKPLDAWTRAHPALRRLIDRSRGDDAVGGMADSRETIRHAKELNPAVHVLARALYLREVPGLHAAGAERVVSAEGEVGLALNELLLQRLGATPDQIVHERDRVRSELREI